MPLETNAVGVGVFRDASVAGATGVASVSEGIVPRMTGRTGLSAGQKACYRGHEDDDTVARSKRIACLALREPSRLVLTLSSVAPNHRKRKNLTSRTGELGTFSGRVRS